MAQSRRVGFYAGRLKEFCRKWNLVDFSVFGSVLSQDFEDSSDIDVLVTLNPKKTYTLFDIVRMRQELAVILERDVDLITRGGLERSHNHMRREAILNSSQVIHAER